MKRVIITFAISLVSYMAIAQTNNVLIKDVEENTTYKTTVQDLPGGGVRFNASEINIVNEPITTQTIGISFKGGPKSSFFDEHGNWIVICENRTASICAIKFHVTD